MLVDSYGFAEAGLDKQNLLESEVKLLEMLVIKKC